ncbi:predicted protein [Sparassis crispa]|uniref:DUF7918 domain-containing protein n=1 Tax=Sparassis crispa TaxID=139825 RepID=A0A401GPV7_9APHY|nr:predicted protein [Sparassis crispa]GBE83794.1 predicted protein [Sparassis crispa]
MYYKNWETTIYCDGYPVDEYCARIENSTTVSCWIPSEAGKKFEVHWRNELDEVASADCYMDGRCMGCSATMPWRRGRRWGVRTGAETFSPYQFTPLVVTDDEDVANPDACGIEDLGVVEVRVCRVVHEYRRFAKPYRPRYFPERGPIHERSKKAGTHCVSLGDGVRCPPHTSPPTKVVYLDRQDRPYIRFIFRYRPRALLQAEGIMPCGIRSSARQAEADMTRSAPAPDAGPYARRVDGGPSTQRADAIPTAQQREPLVKEEVLSSPNPAGVVLDLAAAAQTGTKRIKREEVGRSRTSAINVDVEVIDLTMED